MIKVFATIFVLVTLSVSVHAKEKCDLAYKPSIDGLYIGMKASDFFSIHPSAVYEPLAGDKLPRQSRIGFPLRNGTFVGMLEGVNSVGHIATLDETIYSYSISFLDAGATYETKLSDFKEMLIKRYQLPRDGWRKAGSHSIKLQCANIQLEIFQDYGAAHTAIGPTFFARDLRLVKIADSLK